MTLHLFLPWPPSTNTYYRMWRGQMRLSAKGRQYKQDVLATVLSSETPTWFKDSRLRIALQLEPPTKRKYDIDNRIKPVLDALQHSGVFDDDEQVDDLRVSRRPVGDGGCFVTIERMTHGLVQ